MQEALAKYPEGVGAITRKFEQTLDSRVTAHVDEKTDQKVRELLVPVLEEDRGLRIQATGGKA